MYQTVRMSVRKCTEWLCPQSNCRPQPMQRAHTCQEAIAQHEECTEYVLQASQPRPAMRGTPCLAISYTALRYRVLHQSLNHGHKTNHTPHTALELHGRG